MRGNGAAAKTQNEPSTWDTFLISLRYKEGRVIELAGNNPIFLNNDEEVWFVYRGQADVFASHMQDGIPVGARTHLFRVADRHALFGMDPSDGTLGLLVGGAQGTQLLRVSRADLETIGQDIEFADLVAMVLDGWITLLSSS